MNVNKLVIAFSNFLNSTHDEFLKTTKHIEDKYQAYKLECGFFQYHWETLVEMSVCDKKDGLVTYGDGADFYGLSSRVTFPSKTAQKQIEVHVHNTLEQLSQKIISNSEFEFNKLVNFRNGCYYTETPFSYVHCENASGDFFIFRLDEVDLILADLL